MQLYIYTHTHVNVLTPYSRVLLEKLILSHMDKKFPAFMEPEVLPLCLKGHATNCTLNRLNLSFIIVPWFQSILILYPYLRQIVPSGPYPSRV
jgi:hypothetical protein